MARMVTGGRGIVCTDATYHGNSVEVSKLTRPKDNRGEVRSIPFPETYRTDADDPKEHFLRELQSVIDSFREDGIPFAGMLVCPILANEGLPNIPEGYMKAAVKLIHQAGIKRLVYIDQYKDISGLEFLNEAGVEIREISKKDLFDE